MFCLLWSAGCANKSMSVLTAGKKSLKDGKSLFLSGHVKNVNHHNISPSVNYIFVKAKIIPQTRTSETPYLTWISLQSLSGSVAAANCTCQAGVAGACKHVAALLFHILEASSKSCTSKPQTWNQPSGKSKRIHQPDFIKNIKIQKVTSSLSLSSSRVRLNRSEFDPRTLSNRRHVSVDELDLDRLSEITNGNSGLLLYTQRATDPSHSTPQLWDVAREENITTSTLVCSVTDIIANMTSDDVSPSAVLRAMNCDRTTIEFVEGKTRAQSESQMWKVMRKGRITASHVHNCMRHINDQGEVEGATHGAVASMLGYYGSFSSAATSWGIRREKFAISIYTSAHRAKHHQVVVRDCGFFISPHHGYLGATPDAVVDCPVCGRGLLEVKNPFSNRNSTITQYAKDQSGCLLMEESGLIKLNDNHPYFSQVQCQMYVTETLWCDFVVCTDSSTDNRHTERILINKSFVDKMVKKTSVFFTDVIVEEIMHGDVLQKVIEKAVHQVMDTMLDNVTAKCSSPDTDVDVTYPCGICDKECVDKPTVSSEMSINCDCCLIWFHFTCVSVNEKKITKKWLCPSCK